MRPLAAAAVTLALAAPGVGAVSQAIAKGGKGETKPVELVAKAEAKATEHAAKAEAKAVEQAIKEEAKAATRETKRAARALAHPSAQPAAAAPAIALPQPVAQAVAVLLPTAAPAPTPEPTAPAAPATPAPAPTAATPTPTSRPTARRPAPRPRPAARRAAAPSTARSTPARTPATSTTRPTSRPAPRTSDRRAPANPRRSEDRDPGAPLTRTVVRALEVIPARVRIALGILAVLGLGLGAAAAAQTLRARRLERQRRRLTADVGVLQSALLPPLPARIGDVRVSAAYRPAAGLAAGGDFYDAFEAPMGRTAVVVGDIAGHGRDVVPLTALVRYSVRAYLDAGMAPRTALQVASAALETQLDGRLVTVAVALVDPAAGRITYACAGHPPPLFVGTDLEPITACSSPPIGAGAPTGRRQTTVVLAPGAIACFATDGLTDARVGPGRLGHEGLCAELAALGTSADADSLLARVVKHSDSQPDDMAVCMVSPVVGMTPPPGERLEELEVDGRSVADGCAVRFLAACGLDSRTTEEAVRQALGAIARTGSAVLAVSWAGNGPHVKVAPRRPEALPLAQPGLAVLA